MDRAWRDVSQAGARGRRNASTYFRGLGLKFRFVAALLVSTALTFPAKANPVIIPFVAGFTGASATTAAVAAAIGGITSVAFSVGAFLGTTFLGGILLNLAGAAVISALNRPSTPDAPPLEPVRFNTRLDVAPRIQAFGTSIVGGHVGIFAEFDEDGNFWYICAHADSEITGTPSYFLDGIPVTLSDGTDGFTAGDVLTDDFCLNDNDEQYEGTGTRVPYFRLYTVTPTSSSAFGAKPSAFTTAFTNLPSDFYLAGVSYTIVRCAAVALDHRHKVFKWRGGLGLGEPFIEVLANFTRMYDPREAGHDVNDSTTWTASTGNAAIVWASFRTAPYGKNRPLTEVNWDKVSEAADICDELVQDRSGSNISRYKCGIAFPDNIPRHQCEDEISKTFDAYVAHDDQGRAYPVVGNYETPSLTFTAERDIYASETEVIDDGEQDVDGVVVTYTSPEHNYSRQQSAPWLNTNYYDGTSEGRFRTVEVLGIQNHNQAVRVAKAMGLRLGAPQRAALGVSLKGLLARGQRGINLELDAEFDGVYEIVSPVETDASGSAARFAVVPLSSDRWDLNSGEEGVPPAIAPALNIDDSLAAASNVSITAVSVATETGNGVRLEATFDAPSRVDRFYRFRYAEDGLTVYEYFSVDMDQRTAFSALVQDGTDYDVQYQTVTASGRATDWSAIVNVTATANTVAPAALAAANAVAGGSAGEVDYSFTTANDANQASVRLYRGSTTTFGDATLITTIVAGANTADSYTETGVAAGTVYCWLAPVNGSGVEGTESGHFTVTVT